MRWGSAGARHNQLYITAVQIMGQWAKVDPGVWEGVNVMEMPGSMLLVCKEARRVFHLMNT